MHKAYIQNNSLEYWRSSTYNFLSAQPFSHIVIDNFFDEEIALKCVEEFPLYEDGIWTAHWLNAIENKKALNHWDKFKKTTYLVFSYLMSENWIENLRQLSNRQNIIADIGLHGGGLHAHTQGGNLNIHLDYSIHPKLGLQRKFNLIVYMTPNWKQEWGGGLELWSHDEQNNSPKEMVKLIENKFNRAVIFDTTQNSWHGLPEKLNCPPGEMRRSFATYYLTEPQESADPRGKALFAPYKQQSEDKEILDLIRRRADVNQAADVWRK